MKTNKDFPKVKDVMTNFTQMKSWNVNKGSTGRIFYQTSNDLRYNHEHHRTNNKKKFVQSNWRYIGVSFSNLSGR